MDNQIATPIVRISDSRVQIYVDLDWRIKAGRLKPGDRIGIDDAAEQRGVPGEIVVMAGSLLVAEGSCSMAASRSGSRVRAPWHGVWRPSREGPGGRRRRPGADSG